MRKVRSRVKIIISDYNINKFQIITFENPILGVGTFEDSDGEFFNAETDK